MRETETEWKKVRGRGTEREGGREGEEDKGGEGRRSGKRRRDEEQREREEGRGGEREREGEGEGEGREVTRMQCILQPYICLLIPSMHQTQLHWVTHPVIHDAKCLYMYI